MTSLVKGVMIVGAKRTPFGKLGGKLNKIIPGDLQTTATKAALISANINPEWIDTATIGNVIAYSTSDTILMARHSTLNAGIPLEKPAISVNKLSGSGFQSIINGIQDIETEVAEMSLAGGTESMSLAPFNIRNTRFGTKLGGDYGIEDNIIATQMDTFGKFTSGQNAEKLAEQYKITREEIDHFSFRSHQLWKQAQTAGRFKEEIAPISVMEKKNNFLMEADENPNPNITIEQLSQLPPLYKESGLVTQGSSFATSDGAGAIILASEQASSKHNLKPLARIVAFSMIGTDPSNTGMAPVHAINNLLQITRKTLNDIDLIEVNEMYSAQTLACAKELKLDMDKLNVNGGAIAIGNPLGATGSRIVAHLAYELRRRNLKYGIGSTSIGGGQGIAIMITSA